MSEEYVPSLTLDPNAAAAAAEAAVEEEAPAPIDSIPVFKRL